MQAFGVFKTDQSQMHLDLEVIVRFDVSIKIFERLARESKGS